MAFLRFPLLFIYDASMKRDMELCRALLIAHESGEKPPELEMASLDEIGYAYVLLKDAGFIEAHFIEGNSVLPAAIVNCRLTWEGHDFLDASRDSKLWKKAKEKIIDSGVSWTVSILTEWLKKEARLHLLGSGQDGQ